VPIFLVLIRRQPVFRIDAYEEESRGGACASSEDEHPGGVYATVRLITKVLLDPAIPIEPVLTLLTEADTTVQLALFSLRLKIILLMSKLLLTEGTGDTRSTLRRTLARGGIESGRGRHDAYHRYRNHRRGWTTLLASQRFSSARDSHHAHLSGRVLVSMRTAGRRPHDIRQSHSSRLA